MLNWVNKEETKQCNAFIANFLGGKVSQSWTVNGSVCYMWSGEIVKEWRKRIGLPIINEKKEPHILLDQLHFHDSWEWIMAVVDKIEALGYFSITCGHSRDDQAYSCEFVDIANHQIANEFSYTSKIEATYLTVIEFIKWYNNVTLGK